MGWQGDKIKREIMIVDFDQEGLKMLDVPLFAQSLKTTWIKKYLDQSDDNNNNNNNNSNKINKDTVLEMRRKDWFLIGNLLSCLAPMYDQL